MSGPSVVRDKHGHATVLTNCRGCGEPLQNPCRDEAGGWIDFPDDALWAKTAMNLAGMLVCEKCHATDERERLERESERAVSERIKAARIPQSFQGLTFDDMDRRGTRERAVSAAWAWAEEDKDAGLLLWGPPGVGKSRLAATAIWHRLKRRPAVWCSVAHLIATLQAAFSDRDRQDALRLLTGTVALVLDDLDKVKPSEQVLSQLFVAIDRRIAAGAPLLITSNARPQELLEKFGQAITSRLLGYCLSVELGGTDRRLGREAG